MRVCKTCSQSYACFGQRRSICQPCKRAYDREYHAKRSVTAKQIKLEKQALRVVETRRYIWNYLLEHPCEYCGETDPVVLEFDHIDPTIKFKAVSELATYSVSTVQSEIEKCRVLCANCHRRHTALQQGWYKFI